MRDFSPNQTWHWSLNTSWTQIQGRRGPKFPKFRIPANRSIGAELKDQQNTSHAISSHRTQKAAHTGPHRRAKDLRGDSSFTHFEVVRMMTLAACMPEKYRIAR